MLLGLSVIWGSSFFLIAVAVAELPPFTIVALRVSLAAFVLWAVVAARGMTIPRSLEAWLSLLVMGVINNAIPFTLITYGEMEIASGLAGILIATTPLFTVLAAGVFLADERTTAKKIAGVLIGMAGVAVMIGPAALQGIGGEAMGQLAVLACAASYASAGVYGRRF
jgi:drug/metabolite transporter (DMT)-like permease